MKIKCISLWQPWASLVARRRKRIETRSWRCPLPAGTLLAIHAAKRWGEDQRDIIETPAFSRALHGMGVSWVEGAAPNLPFGAVVGVVRLGECVTTTEAVWRPGLVSGDEGHFGDYSPGRFAWVFDAALSFAPVPERGRQSIWEWEVPEGLRPAVGELLREKGAT